MLPRDRGVDRPGRLGAGLPRHPAAVGLLRRQARHPGLHRVAALRADPRRQPRAGDDGAAAGAEHAAVRAGSGAACRASRSRCRRSSSRRSPPRRSSGRPASTAARCEVGCSTVDGDPRQQGRCPGSATGTWPATATRRSRRPSPRTRPAGQPVATRRRCRRLRRARAVRRRGAQGRAGGASRGGCSRRRVGGRGPRASCDYRTRKRLSGRLRDLISSAARARR